MKNLYYCFFAALIAGNLGAQITYCTASATSSSDEEIFNVTFATLSNTSDCSSLGTGSSVLNRYNDYTNLPSPVVSLGANYPLSVTVGQCGTGSYSGYVRVWIDYNQNGVFTDPGEDVFTSASTLFVVAGTVLSAPSGITIPTTAMPGTTRMRVIGREISLPSSCGTFSWGEVEDYNITILSPSPLDMGISAFLKPINKTCFSIDTIIARVSNYGSDTIDFSINPTLITVLSTGANVSSYTMAITSGTLDISASQDFTLTTTYNMSNLGAYYLKGFTTVSGDGSALNDTLLKTINRTPNFTKSILPNDTVCQTKPTQLNAFVNYSKQVGNGTLTNFSTSYPSPYGNDYEAAKHHFLILASELSSFGLVAGNFTSIAFNATSLNTSNPLVNYNIAIATTTVSNLTGFSTETFANYFSATSYTPVLGINNQILSTPFAWDGISNLVIETCFSNETNSLTSQASNNVSVTQTSTTFTSSVWYRANNSSTVCTTTNTITNFLKQRPNFYFEQIKPTTYTWSPAIGLSATNVFNPTATLMNSQTYSVAVNVNGCLSYDTLRITIKPANFPNLGSDTNLCVSPYVLNANVTATTSTSYLWNNSSVNNSISVANTGKYWVQTTSPNGCVVADTINIVVSTNPIVTLGADTSFCAGSTINLYCGNSGSTILWNTGANTPFITVGTVGTYSVMVTNAAGCKKSDAINVGTKAKPTVSLNFTGQTHFCPTSNTPRPLTEGTPSGGTYIGSGVTGNNFIPSQANQGSYVIIYSYTGPNGCSNTATDVLVVDACVGLEELTEVVNLNVYPNPNTGAFTLEINSASEINGKINITSVDGKLVYENDISGNGLITKNIDITDLANGIYYLQLQSNNSIKTYKLLKQ